MRLITILALVLLAQRGFAAGAVVGEPGSCFIEIGIYTAHFTIYQPDSRGNEEFCEDLPDTGNTLFVLDYLHGSLKDVPVEFRIIRDVENWGIFTRWDNVRQIEDIDARTVFYQPPIVRPENRLSVEASFIEPGGYIGVISAPHSSKDKHYYAVFPFQVGRIDWAPWLLAAAISVAALSYWQRRRRLNQPEQGNDDPTS
ncbi:MAG: hypothetical protein ABJ308_19070 [Halieaceae bacterium]